MRTASISIGKECLALTLMFFSLPEAAEARTVCDYFKDYQPEFYRRYCNGGPTSGSLPNIGGALASFSDAFNLNPASIPTHPTPLGVELIATPSTTPYGGTNYNFAVIHGFQRFGAALSTNSDNTFYSNKNIWTLTASLGPFLLTGATRYFDDIFGTTYVQYHAALQWRVSDRIALGYLLNYVPGASSFGAQVFLF
jgi:hypothetical protein